MKQLGPGVSAEEKENPNIFLVGSSRQRLLSGAEDVGLFKEFSDGSMRAFTCANKHNFRDFKGEDDNLTGLCPCFICIDPGARTLMTSDFFMLTNLKIKFKYSQQVI